MNKEYVRPELNILSLVVEDSINNIGLHENDDEVIESLGAGLGDLFN